MNLCQDFLITVLVVVIDLVIFNIGLDFSRILTTGVELVEVLV